MSGLLNDRLRKAREKRQMTEYFTISNSTLLANMTEEDRVIARSVYNTKQHLGPLGMVEIAYMLGKLGGRVRDPSDETDQRQIEERSDTATAAD